MNNYLEEVNTVDHVSFNLEMAKRDYAIMQEFAEVQAQGDPTITMDWMEQNPYKFRVVKKCCDEVAPNSPYAPKNNPTFPFRVEEFPDGMTAKDYYTVR